MKRLARMAAHLAGGAAAVAAIAAGVLLTIDWNVLRSPLADQASAAAGRVVEIRGDPRATISLTPEVVARDVVIANADWGSRPDMLKIEELYVRFRVLPLLAGRMEIDSLRLVRPDLFLEARGEDANWRFGTPAPKERTEFPVLRRLAIEDGAIGYRSDRIQEPVAARLGRSACTSAARRG